MATQTEREAEDRYEARYDRTGGDVPSGDFTDNSYVSAAEGKPIPVVPDEAPVDDPVQPPQSNSDKELGKLFWPDGSFKLPRPDGED